MTDANFESRLSSLLNEYSAGGVRPIDRFAIAELTIAGGGRASGRRRLFDFGRRSFVLVLVGLLILALAASVAFVASRILPPAPRPAPRSYVNELVSAPDLATPITSSVLVPLQDGRVLVIGASGSGPKEEIVGWLYDPASGTSMRTGPIVSPDRYVSSAVQLKDGRVLMVGDGMDQIFDPTTMQFASVGPAVTPRSNPAIALLHDGRVLIAGGRQPGAGDIGDPLRSAELFDPVRLTSPETEPIGAPTGYGRMVTLPDGRVFLAKDPAEIFDPVAGTFSAASGSGRGGSGYPVALPDGRVVLFGSTGLYDAGSIEVWDPNSQGFTYSRLPEPLTSATLLDDGRVFVIGMCHGRQTGWTGLYDPATGNTMPGPPTVGCRPMSARLTDGRVIIVGGTIGGDALEPITTVEIYR